MENPITVFKCPCDGKKFLLAGKPNDKPTLKEKREHGELIALGCSVLTMSIDQFRREKWQYCVDH